MKTIHVEASVQYDILIGSGLLKEAGKRILELEHVKHVMIVSDDHIFPLYGEMLKSSLEDSNIKVDSFVFPHGESSKCLAVYEDLMEELCSQHMTRSDLVLALGGGVTGDLAGFAAATYQRGIRLVQIPTSLLAAVDSSVGGKTAVNLRGGKNQAGCFYQPSLVLCDIDTLQTLPEEEYRNGCAEVIKYGMIWDRDFLKQLQEHPAREWQEEVIFRCASMKRDVVMRDEFDTGERMLLNFGHTLGHGVEKCSDYQIPHGYAVAMGMAAVTKISEAQGICECGTYEWLKEILEEYQLPVEIPYATRDLLQAAASDKKQVGGTMHLIVPEAAGRCVIRAISLDELARWLG